MRLPERVRLAGGPGGMLPSVLASVFMLDLLTGLIVVGFGNAYLVRILHAPPSYPAFALAVYGTTKLLAAPLAGWLVDRASSALVASVVAGLEVAGIAVMLLTGTAEGYVVGVAPLSAGTVLGWLLVLRTLGEALAPGGRGPASAYLGLVGATALGTGLALAALLAEHPRPQVALAAGLVAAACSVIPLRRIGSGPTARAVRERRLREAPGRRELAAGLVLFAHFGAIGSVAVTFGPYALDELGQTLLQMAVLLAPAAAAAVLAMLVSGRRSRHAGRLREAAPLYAVAAAAALFCATTSDAWWFAAGAVPLGAAIGAAGPLVNAARIDVSSTARTPGAVLARLSIAEGIGEALVPFLVGLAIAARGERAGMAAVGVGFAVIAMLTAVGARVARL